MLNFKLDEALVRPCGGAVRDSVTGGGRSCRQSERLGRAFRPDPWAQTYESRALCPRDPGRIR
jgi:hypothetical protein